jgi:hypothetical protein
MIIGVKDVKMINFLRAKSLKIEDLQNVIMMKVLQ